LNLHNRTDNHIRKESIKNLTDENKKLAVKIKELERSNDNWENDYNDLCEEINHLTDEKKEKEEKIDELEDKVDELEKKVDDLMKKLNEKEGFKTVTKVDSTPFNNYGKTHEKYRGIMERLFGVRPSRYVARGDPRYAEYNLIRSMYATSYNSIQMQEEHLTTNNTKKRVTIGFPTLAAVIKDDGNLTTKTYYIKFHIYMKDDSLVSSVCGFDGAKEYTLLEY